MSSLHLWTWATGLTDAREVEKEQTHLEVSMGRTYGQPLLQPTAVSALCGEYCRRPVLSPAPNSRYIRLRSVLVMFASSLSRYEPPLHPRLPRTFADCSGPESCIMPLSCHSILTGKHACHTSYES